MNLQEYQIQKFFEYVSINSQSNAHASCLPSTEGQRNLARKIYADLNALGLENVLLHDNAIVSAKLPSNTYNCHSLGFVAHLDTVDIGLSGTIKPQILSFNGGDVLLNKELGISLKVSEHPEILPYKNEKIIFSDGTSVLGADNKAAIATIMTALKAIIEEKRPHGDIYLAFVPDEEIGLLGAKALDLSYFKPDFAYTIDCCELGEVVYETFNAALATISIKGVTAHPMNAKGVLVNPILIATDIINALDRQETPEHTEAKEGYIWANEISGNQSKAYLKLNIRDHDITLFTAKKQKLKDIVANIQKEYSKAEITLDINDSYSNIADTMNESNALALNVVYEAMQELGITPKTIAMRGGTDGSALSARGIFTPNYFTGAHNFHSIYEFLPLSSFYKSLELTLAIIRLVTQKR